MSLADLLTFAHNTAFITCVSGSQNAIEDKLDKKLWPFIAEPAPINTTQTAVRSVGALPLSIAPSL